MRIVPNAPAPKIDKATGLPPTQAGRGISPFTPPSPEVLAFFERYRDLMSPNSADSISR